MSISATSVVFARCKIVWDLAITCSSGNESMFCRGSDLPGQSGQALLRRTQVGQLHSYIFLDFDSRDVSGVLILSFKKWYPIWSLMASPTGKTAQLADVLLLPGPPWYS